VDPIVVKTVSKTNVSKEKSNCPVEKFVALLQPEVRAIKLPKKESNKIDTFLTLDYFIFLQR
jgi:hypothetical protein